MLVTFSGNEDGLLTITPDLLAQVLIVDDEINEGNQYFVVHLEVASATNSLLIDIQANISICEILDNDGEVLFCCSIIIIFLCSPSNRLCLTCV